MGRFFIETVVDEGVEIDVVQVRELIDFIKTIEPCPAILFGKS